MKDFVHLHTHSHYSLLDSLIKIKDLVKAAKKGGFKAVSLVDYGSMYGAIEFYQQCKKNDIKPIIGFEAYISPRGMLDKDPEKDKELYHLVLLAENYEGYRNLMVLTSKGHLDGFHNGKPRIDKALLKEYSKGIIALSACIKGEVPQLLKSEKLEEAKAVALEYNDIFGQDNFYLELQDHPAIPGQIDVNTKMIELSKDTGIPLVVTRDVHYLEPEQAEAVDVMTCIREGWKVGYTDREDFRQVDRSMNTGADIASRFRHVPEALENTSKIADRINVEIELDNWHFAPVDLPVGKDANEHLRDEAYKYVTDYYPALTKELEERIEYELDIIKTKGYSPYFICVADYVRFAKSQGIVESTRGSAAGSLVSYVLGITTVDPMRFKLPFERFLNPFRPSPPDVDTDFADDRREEMIKYVTDKYGADRVAQIITFGTMAAKASVRDVGRALGFAYSFCDQVSKLIPQGAQGFPMTIARALLEEPDLKKLYDTNEDVKKLLDLGQQVEGCARHTSIHAAGVVISPTPLVEYGPVQRETGGDRITTQYDMHAIEAAGVLKNDFLGIRNLAILGNAVEIVKKTTGEDVNIYTLPLDDTKTFEMLARGETMGVFQLSGSGMTRWVKELKPNRIDDIMAMVALYRPGPMESIPEYIDRKYNPEKISYLDPRLEEILEASYGLLVYQDDVMLTAIKLAGYDWLEADKFRKAMGKKIPEEMAKQKIQFYDGCKNIGKVPKNIVDELWRAIEPFAAYGFNKAHAASYGIVAYQTAYMKAHYPVQYMTSVLAAEAKDTEKVAAIVGECKRMEITVLPPDINESFKNFAMVSKHGEPGRIRFGLSTIKGLGDHISEVIYRERKENGSYKDLKDFLERIEDKDLNKKSLDALIKTGALDCFGHDRGLLISNIENILFFVRAYREKSVSNQDSLFAGTAIALDTSVTLKPAPDATMDDKLIWEKTLLGLYVSSHPFAPYEKYFRGKLIPLNEIEEYARDEWVTVGGVVDAVVRKITKKGKIMLFVRLLDQVSNMELLVFPKKFEETKELWEVGKVMCIVGKTPREHGDNKIFVENVYVLTPENGKRIAGQISLGNTASHVEKKSEKMVEISLTQDELKECTPELKTLFDAHPGSHRVYLNVMGKKIRTQAKVDPSLYFSSELEDIVGSDKYEVFD